MLERLAHLIVRRRRVVIGVWIVLTLVGAYSAGVVSKRWYQSFSIPGYSGYETNQATLRLFGSGAEQVERSSLLIGQEATGHLERGLNRSR